MEKVWPLLVGFSCACFSRGHFCRVRHLRSHADRNVNTRVIFCINTFLNIGVTLHRFERYYSADNVATSQDFYVHYYVKSWTRAPPYLVGIWTGWYLNVTQQSSRKLSKVFIDI